MSQPRKTNSLFISAIIVMIIAGISNLSSAHAETGFKSIPTQYLAALAEPGANSGNNAQSWGLWRVDPGPRGVPFDEYENLAANGGVAPAKWTFDSGDWWLEENGRIMEAPEFPVPPGRYLVTGNRIVQTVLTIHPKQADGSQRWELADGATVFDVTHLRCRSGRYTPAADNKTCTPAAVRQTDFPVAPGALMPTVENCSKQDYTVLFIVGIEE